jgi:hypothetical protein
MKRQTTYVRFVKMWPYKMSTRVYLEYCRWFVKFSEHFWTLQTNLFPRSSLFWLFLSSISLTIAKIDIGDSSCIRGIIEWVWFDRGKLTIQRNLGSQNLFHHTNANNAATIRAASISTRVAGLYLVQHAKTKKHVYICICRCSTNIPKCFKTQSCLVISAHSPKTYRTKDSKNMY